ncbi:hypothetical protein JJB07_00520 [Tumebacillus sp. ITR2]|uniref:RiboL-PSP-HEPN domain-containing protein n=1 Tax=Tumebacillus amylolyticus TaxID=2801339 RepID=A0ABS1J518_9BACL|nr:HEPN domain-containing protein [Tumebacillus amylolyticus]MBL0385114.1 hypothetical protein [Tumebacillus amylolyticus]
MSNTPPFEKYTELYNELISLTNGANARILQEVPDAYIYENVNFFLKSFMVVACVYLETYLKEVSQLVVDSVQLRLKNYPLPHNLIKWSVDNNKDKVLKFSEFELEITKKDIDDIVSGNIGKTINLFTKIGVDIASEPRFDSNKDVVGAIVTKRNNIVHHNDDANDLTFQDVINYIDTLKVYIQAIDDKVMTSGLL